MRLVCKLLSSVAIAIGSLQVLSAQDLRPRAYVITPIHSNAVIVGYAFNDGSIFFGAVLPITDASGQYSVPNISYYHSVSFFKRSANFTATLPYVVGTFQGEVKEATNPFIVLGWRTQFFASVNLIGGPAMAPRRLCEVETEDHLGISIQVVAPTGQYYPGHLISPGSNRWAFKPGTWFLSGGGTTGFWMHMELYGCSPQTITT